MNRFLLSIGLLTVEGLLAPLVEAASPPVIKEVFFTTDQSRENIDSPAVWHAPDGDEHLLFATSKAAHSVNVFDAVNGAMLQRVGGFGLEPGQFNRPNGVWVIDDLLMVVERDNRRVQVLSIPSMKPLASFGEDSLRNPYGLFVLPLGSGKYHVYVTDNYESELEEMPEDHLLGKRVHLFEVESEGQTAEGELVKTFGETSGSGRLFIVESIYGDPSHDQLLVAEELEDPTDGRAVKIYNLNGDYSGRKIGEGIFKAQVEGIALYATSEKEGYWFITDQSKTNNIFHVFERGTLEYLGAFRGERTLNTDGIWVTRESMRRFPKGAFYACDNDRAISVFDMEDIFEALELP